MSRQCWRCQRGPRLRKWPNPKGEIPVPIHLIPKPTGGDRPIGITPLLAALFIRCLFPLVDPLGHHDADGSTLFGEGEMKEELPLHDSLYFVIITITTGPASSIPRGSATCAVSAPSRS